VRWYANVLVFETVYLRNEFEDPDRNYAILRPDGTEVHLMLDEPPASIRERLLAQGISS